MSGFAGGMNCYGVKHLVFIRDKDGVINLNVYADKECYRHLFNFVFHPDWRTGEAITMDLPPVKEEA